MTDDVIREDAERLVRWSRCMVLGHNTFNSFTAVADATDVVATRLLELLPPADDAEPVTNEWLKAVGLDYDESGESYTAHMRDVLDSGPSKFLSVEHDYSTGIITRMRKSDGYCALTDPLPTRGHVRRLCSALGIQLKGSK